MMEFMDGVKKKETLGIGQILEGDYTGKTVEMEGAVHTIRDMGEVAFVSICRANWRHIKCQNSSSRSTRSREPITENCSVKN